MDTVDIVRWLGGTDALRREIHSDLDFVEAVEQGLPTRVIEEVLEGGKLRPQEVYDLVVPRRTLSYRKQKAELLSREESDRLARVARVMAFAEETFQDEEKARRWMRRPNRALAGRMPMALLETEQGALVVEAVLGRIAHGVFS